MKRAARFCFAISDAIAENNSEDDSSAVEKALRGDENRVARRSKRRTDTASAPSEIREALGLELGHARRRFARDGAEEFLVPLRLAGGGERPSNIR